MASNSFRHGLSGFDLDVEKSNETTLQRSTMERTLKRTMGRIRASPSVDVENGIGFLGQSHRWTMNACKNGVVQYNAVTALWGSLAAARVAECAELSLIHI